MKPTARLHEVGQSLWLDNITREMLDSGQLGRHIEQYSVTGLTSHPSIFDKAIASGAYDDEIHDKATAVGDGETLFFELIEDLLRAADVARVEDLDARMESCGQRCTIGTRMSASSSRSGCAGAQTGRRPGRALGSGV
jgi:hypothetical protein